MSVITGEKIWVTGASKGIGRALAIRLARQGNLVFASARESSALSQLAASDDNIVAIPFDVTDENQLSRVGLQISQHCQYLDRVILSAGNCEYLDINKPDWAMMRRIMDVNFLGAVNTLALAMPLLEARPGGNAHIIGIASLATRIPFTRAEAYGASKAALQYFLESLRVDLGANGIDVTVVNPGFVDTPLTRKNDFSMPFLVSSEKAAQRIISNMGRRPYQYDFPRRLSWILKLLRLVSGLWPGLLVKSAS